MKTPLSLLTALLIGVSMPAFAEGIPTNDGPQSVERHRAPHGDQWKKGDHKERFANATPEQKKRHEEMKKRWENASPEERERMKEHHKAMRERWKNASPEQKERMKEMHGKMKDATPEEREQMRARFEEKRKQWENMTPDERASAKARHAIERGENPTFPRPEFSPRSTEGGVTELPRRHQAR